MDFFQIFCAICIMLLAIYYYYTSIYNYWKVRGIPGPEPTIITGNFMEVFLKKISINDKLRFLYNKYKNEPMFGIFEGSSPILVLNDLDLIKDVLIKDFSIFSNRGFRIFPKVLYYIEIFHHIIHNFSLIHNFLLLSSNYIIIAYVLLLIHENVRITYKKGIIKVSYLITKLIYFKR